MANDTLNRVGEVSSTDVHSPRLDNWVRVIIQVALLIVCFLFYRDCLRQANQIDSVFERLSAAGESEEVVVVESAGNRGLLVGTFTTRGFLVEKSSESGVSIYIDGSDRRPLTITKVVSAATFPFFIFFCVVLSLLIPVRILSNLCLVLAIFPALLILIGFLPI